MNVMCRGVECSILQVDTIIDNTFNGLSMEFDVDSSMESIWNSTWICNVSSLEIPWNPHRMLMEWYIPYGFHSGYRMKNWLGCQPKNSSYGVHGMGLESTHSIWNILGSVKTSHHATLYVSACVQAPLQSFCWAFHYPLMYPPTMNVHQVQFNSPQFM